MHFLVLKGQFVNLVHWIWYYFLTTNWRFWNLMINLMLIVFRWFFTFLKVFQITNLFNFKFISISTHIKFKWLWWIYFLCFMKWFVTVVQEVTILDVYFNFQRNEPFLKVHFSPIEQIWDYHWEIYFDFLVIWHFK